MIPRLSASHRFAALLLAAALVLWLALLTPLILLARLPNERSGLVLTVFSPSLSLAQIFAAIVSADADIVRATWLPSAWVVASEQPGLVGRLRQAGAWAAFDPIAGEVVAVGGCLGPVAINRPAR